jgi:hypothetical protein
MPGGSRSLTIPGIQESLLTVNRSKFTAQEANSGRCTELKPYEMGMQVSCDMDTEVSEEDIVRGVTEIFGFNVQGTGYPEGVPGDRGASFIRSYSHTDIDTTQVFSFSGCRLSKRKKCHSDSNNVHGAEKEFYRSTFLGSRLVCVYGWYG